MKKFTKNDMQQVCVYLHPFSCQISDFSAILGCNRHVKSELRQKHSRQTRTTCIWNVWH